MTLDERLFFFLHSFARNSKMGDAVIVFFAQYLPFLIALAYLYFCAMVAPQFGTILFLSMTLVPTFFSRFILVPIIRALYNRPRPYETLNTNPLFKVHEPSFPSGHAVFFCSLAVATSSFSPTWGFSLLIGSVGAAIFRVIAGVHYPSDVLVGGILGVGTTVLFQYFFGVY